MATDVAAGVERRPAVIEESLSAKLTRFAARTPVHLTLIFIGLLWLIPTFGLFVISIYDPGLSASEGWWNIFGDPSVATLDNYRAFFDNTALIDAVKVTVIVTIGATILPVLIAALAGYAFAWIEFPGRDWIFIGIIALLALPIQMALIPIYRLYNTLNLYDTLLGLILFHTAFALPFAIFLLRNFFIGIPRDLMEAARIDGASELRIFFKIILPLGLPAIASLAIFQVLFVWNDLIVGLTLAADNRPLAPVISQQLRQFGSNLDVIAPAAFISLLVPLTIFMMFQRYFVQGLLAGSVK
jgi:alpha-glucoside transport system permease protein